MEQDSPLQNSLTRYRSEETLFSARPSRLGLSQLDQRPDTARAFTVNVWRNHAFEGIAALMEPYAWFGGFGMDFVLGGYDDSLSFSDHSPADLELIWLDSSRYDVNPDEDFWFDWLKSRIALLRDRSSRPIILCSWNDLPDFSQHIQSVIDDIPDTYFADLEAACADAGVPLTDPRTAALSGSPIGNAAQIILARELACRWIASALLPPVKALAVDLDNTLHQGVLGEDGIDGVTLTPAHVELQNSIKSMIDKGIFVALVSKNELSDVQALFKERSDFPLQLDDFSAVEVSWDEKANAIARVAEALRIATDSILFVDDNIGELTSSTLGHPDLQSVFATSDAAITRRALEYYPGLWRWHVNADDQKRVKDLKANLERDKIQNRLLNASDYFETLKTTLEFRIDSAEELPRLADLCTKTNQFNLSVKRFKQSELSDLMQRNDAGVVSIKLSDLLSDSGIVGVIVARKAGDSLVIDELCISCRALGRHLEDAMILCALQTMEIARDCKQVVFKPQTAPRNQPARSWLGRLTKLPETELTPEISVAMDLVVNFEAEQGLTLEMDG